MRGSTTLALSCRCGSMRGRLARPTLATRTVCYCDDCQLFAERLGRSDILDTAGGTDLLQVTPSQVHIEVGLEHLACLRLGPKGIYRWYAGCCHTPIGNTAPVAWVAFVGIPTVFVPEAAASPSVPKAVEFRVQLQYARGAPQGDGTRVAGKASFGYASRTIGHLVKGVLRRTQWPSPYFLRDGVPAIGREVPIIREPLPERPSLHP